MENKEENEETEESKLELDKLDLVNGTTQSAAASRVAKTHSKPAVSDRKGSTFRKIVVLVSKNKVLICAFLACLVVGSVVAFYLTPLLKILSDGAGSGTPSVGRIVYEVSSPIGNRHYVRFTLSVPYKDNNEKADLMQKLPKIKDELLISGGRGDLAQSIEQKDLNTLKKGILKIVNDITGVPIGQLDMEGLSLD